MSWIGGDLGGLQAMGTTMKGAPNATGDVVKALGSQADKIVGDVGWKGNAADKFRKAWTVTSIQMGLLSTVTGQVGQAIGDLGDKLQHIEADLYNAAQEAKARGAQIGDDGKPLPLVITGNPDSAEAKQARQAQQDYTDAYNSAVKIAQGDRLQAAKAIADAMKDLEPTPSTKDNTDYENWTTAADYLRGLYVVPNEKNSKWAEDLPDKIKAASAEVDKAQTDLRSEFDKYYADNKTLPIDDPARTNLLSAVGDLRQQQTLFADAEAGKGEQPLSKILNVKVADLAKAFPELGKLGADVPDGLKFLKDIPVVDVAASGLVAELQAQDDMQKGWSSTTAHVLDYSAAGVGLAAGAGVGAAAAVAGAPVTATVVGAGFVVVGVGDAVYEGLHEDWDEDIDDRGYVSGITHGLGHTFSNTGGDIAGMGKSVAHVATSLWHKVF